MKIRDVELELDIYDADAADAVEESMRQVVEDVAQIEKQSGDMSAGECVRAQCASVFQCFDTVFGAGTAKRIFGDRVNLAEAVKAFRQLVLEVERQKRVMSAELSKMRS